MSTKTLSIKLSLNDKQFQSSLKKATNSMKKFGRSMQRTGQTLTKNVTLPVLGLGAAAVKLASDYQESLNKVNVAFGKSSAEVQAFAKTTLNSFGIAEGSALEMASLFGDMATSMGLSQKEAAGMSASLVGLAGDLASFKNIGIEQAQTALAGIFTGETETLKKLGIVMTEANLKSFALSKGLDANVKSMTQAEKVALRYSFIMESTANAQGDFARTSGGFANQFRVLQESIKQLGEQFGTILLPLATRMVAKLREFATTISNLTREQKETIIQFAKYASIIGPAVLIIGKLSTGVAGLIKNLRLLTAFAMANPFTLLATAATALVGIMGFAVLDTEKFIMTAIKMGNVGRTIAKVVLGALSAINPKYRTYFALVDQAGKESEELENSLKDSTSQIDKNKEAVDKLNKSLENLNKTQAGAGRGATPVRSIQPITAGKVDDNLGIPKKLKPIDVEFPEDELESFEEAFFDFSEDFKQAMLNTFNLIGNGIGQISNLFDLQHNKRMTEIENEKQAEIAKINSLNISDEQRTNMLIGLDKRFDAEKKKAQKRQAKRAKAVAVLEAIVNTASAVVEALPIIPLAIAVGAMGAAQIATIASTPLPAFAEGGLVSGATLGLIGEGPGTSISNPEVIAPLDKLKNMIGGQSQRVIVEGVISGEDIFLTNERQKVIQGR